MAKDVESPFPLRQRHSWMLALLSVTLGVWLGLQYRLSMARDTRTGQTADVNRQ